MRLLKIYLPQYSINQEPDAVAIGKIVDDEIRNQYLGRSVVVRGVASSEHPGKTADELIDIIKMTGTDRYDPGRKGDRYENIDGKHIDFFGVPAQVKEDSEIFKVIVWGFYHSAKAIHGYPVRIDVVIIYDADQLNKVMHRYEGREDEKDDGFCFRDDAVKAQSILGIIKLL